MLSVPEDYDHKLECILHSPDWVLPRISDEAFNHYQFVSLYFNCGPMWGIK